jgi:YHS domain-containing protein
MQRILSVQDRINLTDVNNIRVIPVKSASRKVTLPLASSNITITCTYCDKKVTEGAVRKKFDDKDYFFCCNTCLGAFEEKYRKLLTKAAK